MADKERDAKLLTLTLVARLAEGEEPEVAMSTNVEPITEAFWGLWRQLLDDLRLAWERERIREEERRRLEADTGE